MPQVNAESRLNPDAQSHLIIAKAFSDVCFMSAATAFLFSFSVWKANVASENSCTAIHGVMRSCNIEIGDGYSIVPPLALGVLASLTGYLAKSYAGDLAAKDIKVIE